MLLVGAPAGGLSPAASVERRAHGSHDRCRPNGVGTGYFENAHEQDFRRRRAVCPTEALHGHDGQPRRSSPSTMDGRSETPLARSLAEAVELSDEALRRHDAVALLNPVAEEIEGDALLAQGDIHPPRTPQVISRRFGSLDR